jgi:hypothetical protein
MSKSVSDARTTRVQKVCTLWTHDDNFSRDDIVFNAEKFPEIPTATGTLLQIVALDSNTAVRDFQSTTKGSQHDLHQTKEGVFARDTGADGLFKRSRRNSNTITVDENGSSFPGGRDIDAEKAYVFAAAALPADLKSKHANLQVGGVQSNCVQHSQRSTGIDIREDSKSLRLPQPNAGYRRRGMLVNRTASLKLIFVGR